MKSTKLLWRSSRLWSRTRVNALCSWAHETEVCQGKHTHHGVDGSKMHSAAPPAGWTLTHARASSTAGACAARAHRGPRKQNMGRLALALWVVVAEHAVPPRELPRKRKNNSTVQKCHAETLAQDHNDGTEHAVAQTRRRIRIGTHGEDRGQAEHSEEGSRNHPFAYRQTCGGLSDGQR